MHVSATVSTRLMKPSHEQWVPLPYMQRAVDFLTGQDVAALFLDPGMRKTSITLEAFCQLQTQKRARKMLVIAPLRVCRLVWRQEAAKWSQFRHLKFSLLHGSKKRERLKDDSDIFLINPEGVVWLCAQFYGRTLPFDIVTIDELTKFKNHGSQRSKALRPRIAKVPIKWGLTGSPSPNGYMDLFGQLLVLDGGAALGRYITHFRDMYFQPDFNGFDYVLQPGAGKRIEERIRPYILSLDADEYLQLPPLIEDPRMIVMETGARKVYEKMKKDMVAELPAGVVTAANSAAVYSKLKQMANGAVYMAEKQSGVTRLVSVIHDAKLEALADLVEELQGKQLMVAYEFEHDLVRLKELFGEDVAMLGKGVSAKREEEIVNAWNRGQISVLLAHPASIGHGLNLQESAACHICWFSPIWDLELFDQFNRRLKRSGNDAKRIMCHILIVTGTIDELALQSLHDKDTTQTRLRKSLNEILHAADSPSRGERDTEGDTTMGMKLSRQGAAEETEEEAPRKVVPKGWGKPAAAASDDDEDEDEEDTKPQKAAIKAKIAKAPEPEEDEEETEEPAPAKAKKMFSEKVQSKLAETDTDETEEEDAPQIRKSPEDRKPVATKTTTISKPKQVEADTAPQTKADTWNPKAHYNLELYVTAEQMEAIAKVLQEV